MGGEVFGRSVGTRTVRVGEIVGWRFWKVQLPGLRQLYSSFYNKPVVIEDVPLALRSVAVDYFYRAGENHAVPGPDEGARYGFYAFKDAVSLVGYYSGNGKAHKTMYAIGEIALWGTVVEGELGYRGEYCRVHRLETMVVSSKPDRRGASRVVYLDEHPLLTDLRRIYGV